MRRIVGEVVFALVLGALIFLMTRQVFQTFRVEQTSMEPTLHEGQFLIVSRLAYAALDPIAWLDWTSPALAAESSAVRHDRRAPARGDIVVLRNPVHRDQHLIKRVVGLPGEVIEIHDGQVWVDRVPLTEPYLATSTAYQLAPQRIPPGHVFVLGDNRNQSFDSHFFGPVPLDLLVGKVFPLPFSAPIPRWPQVAEFLRI